jgi:hypothetical protein
MTRMPPQAYTKEVLASAFDWLSRQNENVKKSIRNSDDLVGLYLKSTRLKEQQQGATSSGGYSADLSSAKSFRNELQGLALNLKQFEDKPVQAPKAEPAMSDYLHELNLMMSTQAATVSEQQAISTPQQYQSHAPAHATTHTQPQNTQSVASRASAQDYQNNITPRFTTQNHDEPTMPTPKDPAPANAHVSASPMSNHSVNDSAETVLLKLDKKTITAINLAKERLNLSSNTEAIRVLVSLGEKHLKKIFGTEE